MLSHWLILFSNLWFTPSAVMSSHPLTSCIASCVIRHCNVFYVLYLIMGKWDAFCHFIVCSYIAFDYIQVRHNLTLCSRFVFDYGQVRRNLALYCVHVLHLIIIKWGVIRLCIEFHVLCLTMVKWDVIWHCTVCWYIAFDNSQVRRNLALYCVHVWILQIAITVLAVLRYREGISSENAARYNQDSFSQPGDASPFWWTVVINTWVVMWCCINLLGNQKILYW